MVRSCCRCDGTALVADADRDVADIHLDASARWIVSSDEIQSLRQGPDVIVRKAESFDFGQFGLLRKGGQDSAESIQGVIQHVHAVAFAVVGFDSTGPFDPHHLGRTASPHSRFAVALLADLLLRIVFHCGRNSF